MSPGPAGPAAGVSSEEDLPDLDPGGLSAGDDGLDDGELPPLYAGEAPAGPPPPAAPGPLGPTDGAVPKRPAVAPSIAKPLDYSKFSKIQDSDEDVDEQAPRQAGEQRAAGDMAAAPGGGRSGAGEEEAPFEALLAQVVEAKIVAGSLYRRWAVRRAATLLRTALAQLGPHELRWSGIGALHGVHGVFRRLRAVHVELLANLALCCLYGEPPDAPPRPGKALECCESAIALDPRNVRAWQRKSKALWQLGRHAEAEAAQARAAALEEAALSARRLPGAGAAEGTRTSASSSSRGPPSGERLLALVQRARKLGNEATQRGEIEHGAFCFEEALRLLWGAPPAGAATGRLEPPVPAARKAQRDAQGAGVPADPEDPTRRRFALQQAAEVAVLCSLALCYLKGSAETNWPPDPDRARRLADVALALEPSSSLALLRRGQALSAIGRLADAEADLAGAARLRPGDERAREALEAVREARRCRQDVRWGEEGRQALAGALERLAGFAAPPTSAPPWPEGPFPAPAVLEDSAEGLALVRALVESAVHEGAGAFAMELLLAIRHFVVQRYGEGGGRRLARIVPLAQAAAAAALSGRGGSPRPVVLRLEGLPPLEALSEQEAAPWSTQLSAPSGPTLAAVREELQHHLAEQEVASASPSRPSELVVTGLWAAGSGFPRTREILGSLEGLAPHQISLLRVPARTKVELHQDGANYLATGAVPLQAGGFALAAHGQSHKVDNRGSESPVDVLCITFFRPEVDDVERYALLLLEQLLDAVARSDIFRQFLLLPEGADASMLSTLQEKGLRLVQ